MEPEYLETQTNWVKIIHFWVQLNLGLRKVLDPKKFWTKLSWVQKNLIKNFKLQRAAQEVTSLLILSVHLLVNKEFFFLISLTKRATVESKGVKKRQKKANGVFQGCF